MCGISGIVNKNRSKVDFNEIKSITDIIAHRGPNGEGFLIENNLALGHRRLAIIDLSSDGNQPMWYDDNYAIVFNGEIYNYLELRQELQDLGFVFKSKTDTEVILVAYNYWGTDCVNRFNGMWAFCIYDKVKQILFCSRDRFGVKPFYYFDGDKQFTFGSELKQLIPYSSKKVNKKVLFEYLILSLEEQTEDTFFESIKRLQPSHNLIYDLRTNKFSIERYFSLQFKTHVNKLPLNESIGQLKSDLFSSIKLRLRSDVEVGTCLSGGLDSSSIAAIVSKEFKLGAIFKGIHAKSTEKYTDESNYAKLVADKGNINIVITEPSENYFINNIDRLTLIHEEPIIGPSIFMQYAVFEKAKQEGCIVMLDGQGGDEILFGYERYFPCLLNGLPLWRKIFEMYKYSRKSRLSFMSTISYFMYFKYPFIRRFNIKKKWKCIKSEYLKEFDFSVLEEIASAYTSPFELHKLELTKTQLPPLLKYEDRNSMAHSIESRLPFLDYRLVENAISLNGHFKINNGWSKYILRKMISEYLPQEIAWRRNKRGFESPRTWLNNRLYFLSEINQSKLLSKITTKIDESLSDDIIWKLFSIAIWEKKFEVEFE